MSPERWQKINEIFYLAVERPLDQRAVFLAEACAGDEQLREEVESLLASHAETTGFIDGSALQGAFQTFVEADPTKQRVGPYKLIREIGEGGMGAVFLAARDDDQYQKHVAIKLIRRGMDTPLMHERFSVERQILASLEHSNIARLFDGGATEHGLPYLVMEYIEGKPIDQYCDEKRLSIVGRLKLFRDICSAVHYAHQRLVIHRDIKPSNILVMADGTPKLLDFGIAKLLDQATGDYTTDTMTMMRMMTPEYASPEHVRGQHVTTASDVYSLGVVLYELLTGRLPYRFKSRSPIEVAQVIAESEPERPSTAIFRVEETKAANAVTHKITPESVSLTREESPDRLRRRLRGDLDNIVLKAMRKEPERRYASVEQLSEDIGRYLKGQPVRARKDTLAYRASKFIHRNKVAVTAAAVVTLVLIASIITTAWQARFANRQRVIAIEAQSRAERRFNEVRKLANSVLFDYHDKISALPGSIAVRERIVRDMLEYLNSLAQEATDDATLQGELAGAYEKVSSVQASIGDTAGAIESRRKGLEILESLLAADPYNTNARAVISSRYREFGNVLAETTDAAGALDAYRKAVAIAEPLYSENPESAEYNRLLARCCSDLGGFQVWQGDWKAALENGRKALRIYERLLADDPMNEPDLNSIAACYEGFAQIQLYYANNPEEALENQRKVIELRESLSASHPLNNDYKSALSIGYYYNAVIYWSYAMALGQREYLPQALENYRRAASISEELAAANPRDASYRNGIALIGVGDVLMQMSKLNDAITSYKKALRMREEMARADPTNNRKRWYLIEACGKTAKALAKHGGTAEALARCRETIDLVGAAGEPTDADVMTAKAAAFTDVAEAYTAIAAKTPGSEKRNRWQTARQLYKDGLDILLGMRSEGTMSSTEENTIEELKREIARCDGALARLHK